MYFGPQPYSSSAALFGPLHLVGEAPRHVCLCGLKNGCFACLLHGAYKWYTEYTGWFLHDFKILLWISRFRSWFHLWFLDFTHDFWFQLWFLISLVISDFNRDFWFHRDFKQRCTRFDSYQTPRVHVLPRQFTAWSIRLVPRWKARTRTVY